MGQFFRIIVFSDVEKLGPLWSPLWLMSRWSTTEFCFLATVCPVGFNYYLSTSHHHYVSHKQGCFLYLPSILSRIAVLGSRCSTAIEWSGGCEFESRSFFTSLSFSHSVSLWCVHSQVPWGGATPLIFRREKWMLRCAAWGKTSLISTKWGKKNWRPNKAKCTCYLHPGVL